jgi:creatinine amidohydrolase/Fe(II)-dependent formamide hydrolase-like protein
MFLHSRRLNEGSESAAHSWRSLDEKRDGCKRALLPIMPAHSVAEAYEDFVLNADRDALILPPIQKEIYGEDLLESIRGSYPDAQPVEVDSRIEVPRSRVVVTGFDPQEAHGHHIPVCSDVLRGMGIARLVKERNDDVSMYPSIWYGRTGPEEGTKHGTIMVSHDYCVEAVKRYARLIAESSDPETIVFFTGHAYPGHLNALREGLGGAEEDFGNVVFNGVFDLDLIDGMGDMDGERINISGHTDKKETSILLYYDRKWGTEYVHLGMARGSRIFRPRYRAFSKEHLREEIGNWPVVNGFGRYDPRNSSPGYGEFLAIRIAEKAEHVIRNPEEIRVELY